MKKFQIVIELENDAFHPNSKEEIITILKNVIKKIELGNSGGNIIDSNGNKVGEFGIKESRRTK